MNYIVKISKITIPWKIDTYCPRLQLFSHVATSDSDHVTGFWDSPSKKKHNLVELHSNVKIGVTCYTRFLYIWPVCRWRYCIRKIIHNKLIFFLKKQRLRVKSDCLLTENSHQKRHRWRFYKYIINHSKMLENFFKTFRQRFFFYNFVIN